MSRRILCVVSVLALLASPAVAAKGSGGHASGGHARSSTHSKSSSTHSSSKHSRKNQESVRGRTADVKIKRSEEARHEFMKQTGFPHGHPGYVIDHIKPLACGGMDATSNMQWQTVAEAKARDEVERVGCR